jgi:hypothetical protein
MYLTTEGYARPTGRSLGLQFHNPAWFWNKIPNLYYDKYEWCAKDGTIPLDIDHCRETGPRYSLKYASNKDTPWSEWHFITPPQYKQFRNQNLIVCSNRNRQKRRSLERERQKHQALCL